MQPKPAHPHTGRSNRMLPRACAWSVGDGILDAARLPAWLWLIATHGPAAMASQLTRREAIFCAPWAGRTSNCLVEDKYSPRRRSIGIRAWPDSLGLPRCRLEDRTGMPSDAFASADIVRGQALSRWAHTSTALTSSGKWKRCGLRDLGIKTPQSKRPWCRRIEKLGEIA